MLYIFTTQTDLKDNQSNQELRWRLFHVEGLQTVVWPKISAVLVSYPNLSITFSLILWAETRQVSLDSLAPWQHRYLCYSIPGQVSCILLIFYNIFSSGFIALIVFTLEHTPTHCSPVIENICSHRGEVSYLHILSTKTSPKVF